MNLDHGRSWDSNFQTDDSHADGCGTSCRATNKMKHGVTDFNDALGLLDTDFLTQDSQAGSRKIGPQSISMSRDSLNNPKDVFRSWELDYPAEIF